MVFAKRSLGQNFLVDHEVAGRIVRALGPRAGERIIEIGPGRGALTQFLVESGADVTAVELDRELAAALAEQFAGRENFRVAEGDALQTDYCALLAPAASGRLISNLPYNVATAVVQRLIEQRRCLGEMVLMLQREVVERMTAPPGTAERGFLSVLVQTYCAAEALFDVAPGAFRPAPKVWSTVVRLRPKSIVEVTDETLYARLIGAAFAQRRKTIANNLRHAPEALRESWRHPGGYEAALEAAGVAPTRRAETLGVEEWARLQRTLTNAGEAG